VTGGNDTLEHKKQIEDVFSTIHVDALKTSAP
jgi:hypothetical protein